MIEPHRSVRPSSLDGNAAGGILSEVFRIDVTAAEGTCRSCARVAVLADALAELDDDGVILRCRGCRHTLLVYVRSTSPRTLELPGLGEIRWSA